MVKETPAGPSLAAAKGCSWAGSCGVGTESCSDWGAGSFTGSDILREEERETVGLDWRGLSDTLVRREVVRNFWPSGNGFKIDKS